MRVTDDMKLDHKFSVSFRREPSSIELDKNIERPNERTLLRNIQRS